MIPRSLLVLFVLASAASAFAGATVNIGVTPTTPGPYQPGEVVQVGFSLTQIGGGGDGIGGAIGIRLHALDFADSDDALAFSNFKPTWDGQAICSIMPFLCGNLYAVDTSFPYVIYLCNHCGGREFFNTQILPANGTITTATVDVSLPTTPGDYILDVRGINSGSNPNRGARLDWDLANPTYLHGADFGGGVTTLTVIPEPATLALLCIGTLATLHRSRRRISKIGAES